MKNVFVLALDEFNRMELGSIRGADGCRFLGLLDHEDVRHPEQGALDFDALLAQAEAQLDQAGVAVDAIIAFRDFPTSALGGVLRNRRLLPGPTNEAIAKCEHKFWSRLEQRAVVPDLIPDFCAVDPFADDPAGMIGLDFPCWIKPIKAHSSHLGFKIRNAADLRAHLPEIRAKIGRFGHPFDQYLRHVDVPDAVRAVGGNWCIAESLISAGHQCTLEGYVSGGEVVVYGVVDSIREGRHRSCFARYQYPSQIPRRVQARMIQGAASVMRHFGYDAAPFNMEFFWNKRSDEIRLLEVNSRLSKSHCPLFRMVDGASHQEVAVDLGLGRRPDFPHREGQFRVAGKFMIRVFEDGIVHGLPSAAEAERVVASFPEARLRMLADEGMRLAHMHNQDSYSFELGEVFVGAESQPELLRKYARVMQMLTFDVEPSRPEAA
ncbi:MAG: D-alanine--D-alanine ligase [Gammaproteobacteria bacterium]|nr:D-alanine--D-alanine ligase [Gammaproteobacteria bacterium]